MKKQRTEILVDGVALSDKQTGVVQGLATIGYYACIFGASYAAAKIADKVYDWNSNRQYKKLLKEEERKAKEEAEKA